MRRTSWAYSRYRRKEGFSLVELLIVTVILGIVVTAIAACLAGGIRVWDTARTFHAVESDALMGVTLLEKEARNAFRFYGIPFRGGSGEVSFPGLVREVSEDGTASERPGTIRYTFDGGSGRLLRRAWAYPRTGSGAKAEVVASRLSLLSIQYCPPSSARETDEGWQPSWDDATNFPSALVIDLTLGREKETTRIRRTVILPVGGPDREPPPEPKRKRERK